MFIDGIIRAIRAPFELLRSKIYGVKQAPLQMRGEVDRLRQLGGEVRGFGQQGVNDVKQVKGRAQQVGGNMKASPAGQQKGQFHVETENVRPKKKKKKKKMG